MSLLDQVLADTAVPLADLGVTITVGSSTITGMFREGVGSIRTADGEMVYDNPRAIVQTSDVAAQEIDKGTKLTIAGVVYKVSEPPRASRTGFTVLDLVVYDE